MGHNVQFAETNQTPQLESNAENEHGSPEPTKKDSKSALKKAQRARGEAASYYQYEPCPGTQCVTFGSTSSSSNDWGNTLLERDQHQPIDQNAKSLEEEKESTEEIRYSPSWAARNLAIQYGFSQQELATPVTVKRTFSRQSGNRF